MKATKHKLLRLFWLGCQIFHGNIRLDRIGLSQHTFEQGAPFTAPVFAAARVRPGARRGQDGTGQWRPIRHLPHYELAESKIQAPGSGGETYRNYIQSKRLRLAAEMQEKEKRFRALVAVTLEGKYDPPLVEVHGKFLEVVDGLHGASASVAAHEASRVDHGWVKGVISTGTRPLRRTGDANEMQGSGRQD